MKRGLTACQDEGLNGEIARLTGVVAIVSDAEAITRLVNAVLLDQNGKWAVQSARYVTRQSIVTIGDDPLVSPPTRTA